MTRTPTAPIEREALYLKEGAELLGMDRGVLSRQIKAGTFPCMAAVVEIAGRVRLSRPALMRWLENPEGQER